MLPNHPASPALADTETVANHRDRPAPTGWAHQFPFATSFKRYIAREVFNSLRDDLADTAQPRPVVSTTIMCGNPGFGINRIRT